jgi:hypothetical protein
MPKKQAQAGPEQPEPAAVPGVQRGTSPPPAKDKPVHEIRVGRIKAVIWLNHTDNGVRHNVTLRRLFKREASAQWEQSDAFGRDDLLLVAEVCRLATLWIFEHGHAS